MASSRLLIFLLIFLSLCSPVSPLQVRAAAQAGAPSQSSPSNQLSEDVELQQALNRAGGDRAAVVRIMEGFLKRHPDAQNRPQIYRALAEGYMQLHDNARAADYAERIVALNPEDIPTTILAIQLLERTGDEAGLRRATSYSTRVLEFVDRSSLSEKSPRVSQEEWIAQKKHDRMSVLALRGRLELKLKDTPAAQKDFEASYAILRNAAAAQKLGEIAELKKDLNAAIQQYARAFAIADITAGSPARREIRQQIGNVWRLAYGSEDGLGEYLLRTYDEASPVADSAKLKKNPNAHEPFEFTLRKAPEGSPFSLKEMKGKVLVVDFWATWCGPCRALEPLYARVAAEFQGNPEVNFLAANCDEDETLVPPYLEEGKVRTTVVFSDGLDQFFEVYSFPTVIIVGRDGKIAYRVAGFNADHFEQDLAAAVHRELSRTNAAAAAISSKP
jgi:thiol-disulfide isomerase/thioredoxin